MSGDEVFRAGVVVDVPGLAGLERLPNGGSWDPQMLSLDVHEQRPSTGGRLRLAFSGMFRCPGVESAEAAVTRTAADALGRYWEGSRIVRRCASLHEREEVRV